MTLWRVVDIILYVHLHECVSQSQYFFFISQFIYRFSVYKFVHYCSTRYDRWRNFRYFCRGSGFLNYELPGEYPRGWFWGPNSPLMMRTKNNHNSIRKCCSSTTLNIFCYNMFGNYRWHFQTFMYTFYKL